MDNVESSAENGSQHNNPDNFYVELNNLELLQIVRDLKDKLQTVKHDNERILELNEIQLDKIHNREKDKRNDIENDFETTSYKHKGKKAKYPDSESSSEVKTRSRRNRHR